MVYGVYVWDAPRCLEIGLLIPSHGKVPIAQNDQSSPTVVFEAGIGAHKETWKTIYNELAQTNSVFAYDRPGTGRSDRTITPRSARTMVDELREILREQNLTQRQLLDQLRSRGVRWGIGTVRKVTHVMAGRLRFRTQDPFADF